jgi:hypothetical protein
MEAALPRVLTKIRIDEVSAVTAGAGEGVKVLLMKRHDSKPHVEEAARASRRAYFLKIFTKADSGADDVGSGDIINHPVVQMARLLVASGKFGDHGQALDYLLNKPNGQALLARMRKAADQKPAKETNMESIEKLKTERTENLLTIGKAGGAVAMAKILVADNDAHGIDESTYTQIVTEHAQKLFPDKTPDAAFAKLFAGTGPDAVQLRKGHAVVRASQFAAGAYPFPR